MKCSTLTRFICRTEGSVLPFAAKCAVIPALITVALKLLEESNGALHKKFISVAHMNSVAYSGFSSTVGFLVIFRVSQSYQRYWTGGSLVQQMVGLWMESASSLLAFVKMSKGKEEEVARFRHLILRLYSLLCALSLMELQGEDGDDAAIDERLENLEIFEVSSFEPKTMQYLKNTKDKIELVFHWIQSVIVVALSSGLLNIPPPILGKVFINLGTGLVMFHECMKIAVLPFPFMYSQVTVYLLICHWLITPVFISTLDQSKLMGFISTFLVVSILWGLLGIADSLENPFGDDEEDLDAAEVQRSANEKLLLLAASDAGHWTPEIDKPHDPKELQERAWGKKQSLRSFEGHQEEEDAIRLHGAYHRTSPKSGRRARAVEPAEHLL